MPINKTYSTMTLKQKSTTPYLLALMIIMLIISCNKSFAQAKPQTPPQPQPRYYVIQGDINLWLIYYRNIGKAIQVISNSDIPTKQSLPLIDSLTLLQQNIQYNVNYQDSIFTAHEKLKADTSHKK